MIFFKLSNDAKIVLLSVLLGITVSISSLFVFLVKRIDETRDIVIENRMAIKMSIAENNYTRCQHSIRIKHAKGEKDTRTCTLANMMDLSPSELMKLKNNLDKQ